MTLINNINGSLITNLSGGSSASSASGNSTINGKGVSASFGGDRVSLQSGLAAAKQAFTNSFIRTGDAFSKFQVTQQAVGSLLKLTDELIDLAERASDPQSTSQERSRINSQFQVKRKDFTDILDETKVGGVDLLDKSDLAGVLKNAGIDPEAATFLSQTFRSVAGSDNVVGFARLVSEPLDAPVIITGTNEKIIAGTVTTSRISGETGSGGAGVVGGQLLDNISLSDTLTSYFNTATDYGSNPAEVLSIQLADENGVSGDSVIKSYNQSIVMLDRADTGVALAVIGDGENARLELYDTTTGNAAAPVFEIGDSATLQNFSGAIDDGGSYFAYYDGSTIKFGSTDEYIASGGSSIYGFDGEIDGGIAVGENGFAFVSSSVDFGGDGVTKDLFFVNGFDNNATITNVTNGGYGDIDLDTVDISSTGSSLIFAPNQGTLSVYDIGGQTITDLVDINGVEAAAINKSGSGVSVAVLGDDGDIHVQIFAVSGGTATLQSEVDLNLGSESGVVQDLSINDARTSAAFVIDGSYLEGADEVFLLQNSGGGARQETIDINGSTYTFDEVDGDIIRVEQLTESSGDDEVNRAFIDNSSDDVVYFSATAELNGTVAPGLAKVTTSDLNINGATQLTTDQRAFAFLSLSDDGQNAVTIRRIEDGSFKLDLFNLNTQTVVDSFAITTENPFNPTSDIQTAISADGTSAVIRGIGAVSDGSDTLYFVDDTYFINSGETEGAIALSDVSTVFFSDATEFGASDGVYDLVVGLGNTADVLKTNTSFDRYTLSSGDTFNTDILSVSQDGSKIATSAAESGALVIVDTNTGEVLEFETSSPVQAVSISDDGSRVAVIQGSGAQQALVVYQVTNEPGTNDLKVEALYIERTNTHQFDNVQINGDGTIVSAVGDYSSGNSTQELFVYSSKEDFQQGFEQVSSVEPPVDPQTGSNPLNQDLSTIGGAQIAAKTLNELRDVIADDLAKVDSIVEELRGAVEFALAGARAFDAASGRSDVPSAEKLASDLVSQIRNATGDSLLGTHSGLDQLLAKELLG